MMKLDVRCNYYHYHSIIIVVCLFFHQGRTIRKVLGGWGKYKKKIHASQNVRKKKHSCKPRLEKKNSYRRKFNLQGKMSRNYDKNTIKRCYDSKFPPECPQIAFLRFRKTKCLPGSTLPNPPSLLNLNIFNSETFECTVNSH